MRSYPSDPAVQDKRHNLTVKSGAAEKKYDAVADQRRRFMPARYVVVRVVLGLALVLCLSAGALAQMPNPYGVSISVEDAKKAAALSLAEAKKNNWTVAVAVVDPSGNLVYYEKMDNTQLGSANVSVDKARSAALFKRPTKAFQDALAAGGDGLRLLRLQGATPIEGGFPRVSDGKIVGGIGVSGATSAQDAQCQGGFGLLQVTLSRAEQLWSFP
jgi:glc operon protein GlcG